MSRKARVTRNHVAKRADYEKKRLSLSRLKELVDEAVKFASNKDNRSARVEFWWNGKELTFREMGQFGIIPDVIIELKKL